MPCETVHRRSVSAKNNHAVMIKKQYVEFPNLIFLRLALVAVQERQTIELHGVTLSFSPIQSMFNVLVFKASLEESQGKLSSSAVANMYEKHINWANPEDAAFWLSSTVHHD